MNSYGLPPRNFADDYMAPECAVNFTVKSLFPPCPTVPCGCITDRIMPMKTKRARLSLVCGIAMPGRRDTHSPGWKQLT
jgi:hypothetical protein